MGELFSISGFLTLLMLILLQAVLGFDNLLYISIESKRVPADRQSFVRKLGIGLAIGLRLVLLVLIVVTFKSFEAPWFSIKDGYITGSFNLQGLITLFGGGFIMYTAVKEIHHMLSLDELEGHDRPETRSVNTAIFWIVLMNLIFSFDSILSAMALTESVVIMAVSIIFSGVLMILLVDHVAVFLQKNRMYEVLGLFILFIVGVMLVSEAGHLAHLNLFGYEVEAMSKGTFYFVLVVLIIVDIVQSRYRKKLELMKRAERSRHAPS